VKASTRVLGFLFLLVLPLTASAGEAPLLDAVKMGDVARVRALAKQRAVVNAADADGATPLLIASHLGQLEAATVLIAAGADVNLANRYGITPLYEASAAANVALMKALLDAGARAGASLPEGETPLMAAARTDGAAAVQLLLSRGASPHVVEKWQGQTALMYAAARNRAEVARALIAAGADVRAKTPLNTLPARIPAGRFNVEFPLGGLSALHFALRQNSLDAARVLLDAGADPNDATPEGYSALVLAILNRHYDAAVLLLERGANPNNGALYAAVNAHNLVPLDVPVKPPTGKTTGIELLKLLLARGANVTDRPPRPLPTTNQGFGAAFLGKPVDTALIRASRSGDAESVRILIEAGADVRAPEVDGLTPVQAVVAGPEIPPLVTVDRERPSEPEAIETIKLLMSRGATVAVADKQGVTPLHVAAQRGFTEVARFLVANGAALNATDAGGKTPLDYALGGAPSLFGPAPVFEATGKALQELGATRGTPKPVGQRP
jgi:ankyrin repeat protein